MRLAFEASRIASVPPTGVNRYGRCLIEAIAREVGSEHQIELFCKISRIGNRKNWFRPKGLPVRLHQGKLWPLTGIPDVIHGLDCYVPSWRRSKKIVTIHDLLPIINDDEDVAPLSFKEKMRIEYAGEAKKADCVVTVSENTRRDVIEFLNIPEKKVISVYPGFGAIGDVENDSRQNKEKPYLLFLGTISGRKNTERLVRAYGSSKVKDDFDLVLVGSVAYRGESTFEAIRELNLEDNVHHKGFLPDSEMISVFQNASGLVFPTIYEGFGFPILEAMMMGVPVLTSDRGSAKEISAGFAELVDPFDVGSIAAGIDRLVKRENLDKEAAKSHAMTFTWERSAREMIDIYKALL